MLELLRTRFVPVAVDQHIHRFLKDDEGKLFARVLAQAGRGLEGTSQGVYLFSPEGKLLEFANTADARRVARMLHSALEKFVPGPGAAEAVLPAASRPVPEPPEGGLIVTVTSRVLGGYEQAEHPRAAEYAASLGRDHLWLRKDEAERLTAGELPESVIRRMARFHLVDNTRGEPPFWRPDEVRKLEWRRDGDRIRGTAHLETAGGDRGYQADLLGFVEARNGRVTRFDVVAQGPFWGEGTFTRGAPKGRFPFAVTFRLAEGQSAADHALPGAARGNLAAYLR